MHRKSIFIDFFFTTSHWKGEPEIKELDKCDDLGWFPIENLPKNIVPSVKSAIDHYQEKISFSEFEREE